MAEPKFSTTGGANYTTPTDPKQRKLPNLPYLNADDPTAVLPLTNTALNQPGAQQQPQAGVQPLQQMKSQVDPAQQQRQQAQSSLITQAQQPQQNSAIQNLVTSKTEGLLNDPTQGWNGDTYKNTQLSNFDDQQAKLFETMRQKFADTADTGIFQKDALGNQLQGLKDRRTLESDIDYENRDYKTNSLINALAQGRETETQNQTIKNSSIDNLVKALGAGESETLQKNDIAATQQENALDRASAISLKNMDTAANENLAILQGKIDSGLLTQKQEWDEVQNDLQRQQDLLLQKGDIDGAKEVEALKGQIQALYQEEQNKFLSSENALDRAYAISLKNMDTAANESLALLKGKIESGLLTQKQDWDTVNEDLNRQQAILLQKGDIQGAIDLENLKGDIAAEYQKTQLNHENSQRELAQIYNTSERIDIEKYETNMKYLDSELLDKRSQGDYEIAVQLKTLDASIAEAKASGDVERTKTIESYRALLEEQAVISAFGRTKEAMDIQAQIDDAKANNDLTRAENLERTKAGLQETYAMNRAAETKLLEQQKFDYDWLFQNNDFSHDEKMANLKADIDEAKANRDLERESSLMTLQTWLDFDKMERENGYEVAKMNLQDKINQAAASKDFEYATKLKQQDIDATVQESAKDRAIQLSELALKQDAAVYAQYDALKATDPTGAAKFLKEKLAEKGITYNPVDAYEQAKNSLLVDFNLAKDQWLMTNPTLEGFNEYYNNTMYGDKTQEEVIDQIVSGQLSYQQLKADPRALKAATTNAIKWDKAQKEEGFGSGSVMKFQSVPEMNTPFGYGQGTVMRVSDVMTEKVVGNDDLQYFNVVDINSGKIIKIKTHQ